MKHSLIPGETTSEKVSCKYYTLSKMESQELYVRWRQGIHNFPTKQTRDNLIARLVVEGQTNVIYDNHTREISEDTAQYDRATRQSDANSATHQASDRYRKEKREDAMDTIRNYVFGSRTLGNFTYTIQKCYLRDCKFQTGLKMKIKDFWRRSKEINNFLPHFPPDKSVCSPRIAPSVLDSNDLVILDGALPSAFKPSIRETS